MLTVNVSISTGSVPPLNRFIKRIGKIDEESIHREKRRCRKVLIPLREVQDFLLHQRGNTQPQDTEESGEV